MTFVIPKGNKCKTNRMESQNSSVSSESVQNRAIFSILFGIFDKDNNGVCIPCFFACPSGKLRPSCVLENGEFASLFPGTTFRLQRVHGNKPAGRFGACVRCKAHEEPSGFVGIPGKTEERSMQVKKQQQHETILELDNAIKNY